VGLLAAEGMAESDCRWTRLQYLGTQLDGVKVKDRGLKSTLFRLIEILHPKHVNFQSLLVLSHVTKHHGLSLVEARICYSSANVSK